MAECLKPPSGWWCSRKAGHDGPCAARRTWERSLLTILWALTLGFYTFGWICGYLTCRYMRH